MSLTLSPHLNDIPQAIRIAASVDPSIDPTLKQQAFDYLGKVKEVSEETWQDCLSLYLQGAGAPGPSSIGRDGKEKLETDLRMFCEQVVDAVLVNKSSTMSPGSQKAMYDAIVDFVRTEYIEGSCEGNQAFLRNKLAFTIAHLFLNVYPVIIPTFLHPFLNLLVPSDQASSLHPSFLAAHLLIEIAQEIHDNIMRSAREWSNERQQRDGAIRDVIRSSGDERLAVEGLLALASKGAGVVSKSGDAKWLELTELALKTLAAWIPWVDITMSLTPDSLAFYQRLSTQNITSLRTASAIILRTFIAKGVKDPSEKLQILKVLNVVGFLDPLEQQTRGVKDDWELVTFRAALAGIMQTFGTELIKLKEMPETPEDVGSEADSMLSNSIPLMLLFLSDRNPEVATAVSPFVADLLRTFKKYSTSSSQVNGRSGSMAPPPTPVPLPPAKRQFLLSVLEVVVRQLEWPEDAEWEFVKDEFDADEDVAAFCAMRHSFRGIIDSIAAVDKTLHTEVVASIVVNTLEKLRTHGSSAVTWQQAELAAYLVYTFGEISKCNSRAAFYELPPELASRVATKLNRPSATKLGGDTAMSSGQSTPTGAGPSDGALTDLSKIDYEIYPLTPLGQLLMLCMSSGLASYPHPSVPLQYFEIGVRYIDFWKAKRGTIQPMLEALLDNRGIHHADETVRRRVFYLFSRFIKECKLEIDLTMIPVILQTLKDVMTIRPKLPQADTPDEDVLLKATTGKSYFQDQLYLFEVSGILVYLAKSEPEIQLSYLGAIVAPLMTDIAMGLDMYGRNPRDRFTVLQVHHLLLALGHFAKGFPMVSNEQTETIIYQQPFQQITEALFGAVNVMKTERIVRDSARFAFSQFVNTVGTTVAELVPFFVDAVVIQFDAAELAEFLLFLNLLMHRLKKNTFQTMNKILLALLSRIFEVLREPVTGTDEAVTQHRLHEAYLSFFTTLMNSNLEGVFITEENKSEFEHLLSSLLELAEKSSEPMSQRLAFSFFAKSVIAWGTSPKAASEPSVFAESAMSNYSQRVASGLAPASNQHAVPKDQRAAQALPGYENFIYQRLMPASFTVPADSSFNLKTGQPVLAEIAMLLRNMLQARGQEGVDFLAGDLLPRLQCPPEMATQLVQSLRTQQSKVFRKTFADFIKAVKA